MRAFRLSAIRNKPRNNGQARTRAAMDWMQFVAALTSALAWPIAVTTIVLVLKNPILAAIPKIRSFKYGQLHIDLSAEIKAVEQVLATSAPEPNAPPLPPPAPSLEITQLAESAPHAAILMAWHDVERALVTAAESKGIAFPGKRGAPHILMRSLVDAGVISPLIASTFKRLYHLRNQVAHSNPLDNHMAVSTLDALSMIQSCEWLVERLNEIEKLPVGDG